jgi:hypothetical protein
MKSSKILPREKSADRLPGEGNAACAAEKKPRRLNVAALRMMVWALRFHLRPRMLAFNFWRGCLEPIGEGLFDVGAGLFSLCWSLGVSVCWPVTYFGACLWYPVFAYERMVEIQRAVDSAPDGKAVEVEL